MTHPRSEAAGPQGSRGFILMPAPQMPQLGVRSTFSSANIYVGIPQMPRNLEYTPCSWRPLSQLFAWCSVLSVKVGDGRELCGDVRRIGFLVVVCCASLRGAYGTIRSVSVTVAGSLSRRLAVCVCISVCACWVETDIKCVLCHSRAALPYSHSLRFLGSPALKCLSA